MDHRHAPGTLWSQVAGRSASRALVCVSPTYCTRSNSFVLACPTSYLVLRTYVGDMVPQCVGRLLTSFHRGSNSAASPCIHNDSQYATIDMLGFAPAEKGKDPLSSRSRRGRPTPVLAWLLEKALVQGEDLCRLLFTSLYPYQLLRRPAPVSTLS